MIISPAKPHHETIVSSPVTLPEELITEVLSSLKVKSLKRFKCVNKSWNSLISDPFFVKIHLIKSLRNPHIILSPTYFSCTSNISLHNPFLILRSWQENPSINLFKKASIYKLMENCRIIGSCNGLTCLVNFRETEFYLWNPATRWLSQKLGFLHGSDYYLFKFSFGYDNLTQKYKVVAIRPNEVRVLTWSDNVWRNIQRFPMYPYQYLSEHVNAGVYHNNSLNWFALRDNLPPFYYCCTGLNVEQFFIISLDLGIESYTPFMFPRGFDRVPVVPPVVCVLKECLCFSHYSREFNEFSFVIWQMKEFGVHESWTKLLKFDYENIFRNYSRRVTGLLVLHVFENGDMLILVRNLKQLICYNCRENRVVKQVRIADNINIDMFNVNHYVESLLSTC